MSEPVPMELEGGNFPGKHLLVDSGLREQHPSGAVREPSALRYDLIPQEAMERMARHYANGAKKYSPRNWERGIPMSRCASSAIGHLFKWIQCKVLDLPIQEDHLAAAAWGCFALMTYEARKIPEIDDIQEKFS